MKAIVGLGNPGVQYKGTRHNVGFAVLDELARRVGLLFESSPAEAMMARSRAGVGPGFGGADDVLLVKPLTFMNLSGQAVGELARYFKIEVADLLIIVDEAQLPLGKLRARSRGSAGGHNGLKSVIAHLGDGRGDERRNLADHVLTRFDKDETVEVDRMIARAADAAETFITSGIAAVMNQYNGGDPATTE